MKRIKVINGIEVFDDEILTLSDNGVIILYADAKNFEKLAKKYIKQEYATNVNKAYSTLLKDEKLGNLKIGSIFINRLNY